MRHRLKTGLSEMMTEPIQKNNVKNTICVFALYSFAFALPVSLPVAEFFILLAIFTGMLLAFSVVGAFEFRTVLVIPIALFVVVALVGTIWSLRPAVSFGKLHRLLFLLVIFQIPASIGAVRRVEIESLMTAFVCGTSLKALYDIFRIPLSVINGGSLYDAGSMTMPQFYMVALCIFAAVFGRDLFGRVFAGKNWQHLFFSALALNIVGLIIHFKRGVWLACVLSVCFLLTMRRRWRVIVALSLCVLALPLLPQVRTRLAQLPEEFSEMQGGRWVLWTKVAPALISEYPRGVGWQALSHEDLAKNATYVQPGLDHLHNNVLQVAVELGIAGALIWILWMLWTVGYMVSVYRRLRYAKHKHASLALGVLAGFISLLLNGFVENNFDDGEIMLLYCLLIGSAVLLRKSVEIKDKSLACV